MGFFGRWNKKESLASELHRLRAEMTLLDAKPKTDTLQPNKPAGDTPMASIPYLTPYLAGSGAITTINDPSHTHGLVAYASNYPTTANAAGNYICGTNAVYTLVSPQYYQAGIGAPLGSQPWPSAAAGVPNQYPNQQWFTVDEAAVMIKPVDRAEFSEEEITQAEQLMEELSA